MLLWEGAGIRLRIDLIQKSTTILLREHPREAPGLLWQWLDILNVNHQQITGLSTFDLEGAGQVVDLRQVHVSHVVRIVSVLDLSACPVDALNLHGLVVLN